MKSRARNVIVGLTVLAALVILAVGIYRFGSAPAAFFKPPQIAVTFEADKGNGLGDGSTINYLGVEAGRVTAVRRDPVANKIIIDAALNKEPSLPANLVARIVFMSPLGGVSSLELVTDGPPTGQVQQGAKLPAHYVGSTFIPPEFSEAAREATSTVRELKTAVQTFNDSKLIETVKATIENTNARITQAGQVMDSVQKLVGDPKLQDDLKGSMTAIRTASESARDIAARVNSLTDKFDSTAGKIDKAVDSAQTALETTTQRINEVGQALADRLRQASGLLDNLTAITAKINEGKGTAGALINDPKLYQGLIDTTTKLNLTLDDIKRYVNQVEQEGFYLRLNK